MKQSWLLTNDCYFKPPEVWGTIRGGNKGVAHLVYCTRTHKKTGWAMEFKYCVTRSARFAVNVKTVRLDVGMDIIIMPNFRFWTN